MQKVVIENNAILGLVATIFVLVVFLLVAAFVSYLYTVKISAQIASLQNTVQDVEDSIASLRQRFMPSNEPVTQHFMPSSAPSAVDGIANRVTSFLNGR